MLAGLFVLFRFWGCRHVGDLEIFKDDHPITGDQFAGFLVMEISTTIAHFAIEPRKFLLLRPVASMRARLTPIDLVMSRNDLFFFPSVMAWILNRLPGREHGKGLNAQV